LDKIRGERGLGLTEFHAAKIPILPANARRPETKPAGQQEKKHREHQAWSARRLRGNWSLQAVTSKQRRAGANYFISAGKTGRTGFTGLRRDA
jgi:hypothetical protein